MFDHGEAVVRSFIERIPDGRYVGRGTLDSDGVDDELVEFDVAVVVEGSSVVIDYSDAPAQRPGPVNSALPKTVSATRVAVTMLAGGGEWPNEGHFRPIEVVTRPGSLFHPLPPAPTFIGGWAAIGAIDAIYRAFGEAVPESRARVERRRHQLARLVGPSPATASPGRTGRRTRSARAASAGGDGAHAVMHVSESATRIAPTEVCESRNPWLVEQAELAPDSGGAGRYRGGDGLDLRIRLLEDAEFTSVVDRTRVSPAGLAGGRAARPNGAALLRSRRDARPVLQGDARAGPGGQRARAPDRRRRRLRRSGAARPRRGRGRRARGLRHRGPGAARLPERVRIVPASVSLAHVSLANVLEHGVGVALGGVAVAAAASRVELERRALRAMEARRLAELLP